MHNNFSNSSNCYERYFNSSNDSGPCSNNYPIINKKMMFNNIEQQSNNCFYSSNTSNSKTQCSTNCKYQQGPQGIQDKIGPTGPQGPQGPAGSISNHADFLGIMPPDNSSTVAPVTDIEFPQYVPNNSGTIERTSAS